MKYYFRLLFILVAFFLVNAVNAYPIDGFLRTGIKRLLRLERIFKGEIKDKPLVKGAMLPSDSIRLNLSKHNFYAFPKIDQDLQKEINRLFPNLDESYSIAIMNYSDSENIQYAERQATRGFQPGSVGKLAVATGLFCALEDIYPYDFEKRVGLLKNKKIRAGYWAIPNIHTVPFFNPETNKLEKRLLVENDVFSLYEWLDHMLSVSSNGAASVVWREVMLMNAFGEEYANLTEAQAEEYFKVTPRKELSDQAVSVINEPLREIGIEEDEFRVGTFFTRGGSNKITPQGGSIGSPRGLMKWIWAMEHGQIVDKESSLELKKLMYMTDRRIRYASNKKLDESAVYFKSGSLYSCQPEPGYECGKYKGNAKNFMNSLAIVETPNGQKYAVALMTNVLRKNSNADHSALGGKIQDLITQRSQ
ncbi:MAG: serine hydrolase [Saprospiraceae bacterium]|nr:serine hydrolase [Saprospiraceae bacterium]